MNALNYFSQALIPFFIIFAVIYGISKKVRVYDSFVSGAKDGIGVIIKIFPYLLAIFVAIKAFQASGAFDFFKTAFTHAFPFLHIPPEVISISIIKPLSGSASLALFTDTVKNTGPDSLASRMSAVILGSAETTFYVLAVYLGAVGIKKTKYLIPVCITADIIGIVVSILIVRIFIG
jgi:spore maturation protein B